MSVADQDALPILDELPEGLAGPVGVDHKKSYGGVVKTQSQHNKRQLRQEVSSTWLMVAILATSPIAS